MKDGWKEHIYSFESNWENVFGSVEACFAGAEYNHSSISLSPTLDKMNSIGRLNPYNHFIGGFVQEWKNIGAFKLFQNQVKGVGHEDQYQSI